MLQVVEESQENTEIPSCHEAHRRFRCYAKAILMIRIHRKNAPTTTSVDRRHTAALNNQGKVKICGSDRIKKLDEDAQRCKKRYRLFIHKALKVLTQ